MLSDPDELARLTADCRTAWEALGHVHYGVVGSEKSIRALRRSLYVVKDVAAGEALTEDNIRSIRPGFGLAPKFLPEVVGRRAARALKRGTALDWSMIS